jgi:hypothetical protein
MKIPKSYPRLTFQRSSQFPEQWEYVTFFLRSVISITFIVPLTSVPLDCCSYSSLKNPPPDQPFSFKTCFSPIVTQRSHNEKETTWNPRKPDQIYECALSD